MPLLERLLPAPLHIAGLRLAHAVRLRWWRLSGRRVRGCRVLVLDVGERVLLIRHSYGSGEWMLPGGGLGASEDPESGALREVAEETAVHLHAVVPLGRIDDPLSRHETHLIAGWTKAAAPRPDRREIIEAAFFAADALPEGLAPRLAERLPGWITAAASAHPER